MLRGLRARLSYANVAATLALFVALAGGVAWALEANSVRSEHIKDGEVRVEDTKPGAFGRGLQFGAADELLASETPRRYFPVGFNAEPLGTSSDAVRGAPAPVSLRLSDLRVELPGSLLNGEVTFTLGDPGSATKQLSCTIDSDAPPPLECRDRGPALEKLFRGDSLELVVDPSGVSPATGIAWSFRAATP